MEFDFYTLLEFDHRVDHWEVQPARIDYVDETGKARHYTPDVLVRYHPSWPGGPVQSPLLGEIKPRGRVKGRWREMLRKARAARAYARTHGWQFRILTEDDIRTPYLANARFLSPYRRRVADEPKEAALLDAMFELGSATPDLLLAFVYLSEQNRLAIIPSLWKLVAEGRIGCDLTIPLTMDSRLWLVDDTNR